MIHFVARFDTLIIQKKGQQNPLVPKPGGLDP